MPRVVLVRHARPEVDAAAPPGSWPLTAQSRADARRLSVALKPLADPVVVASSERKAVETAELLALGPVRSSSAFDEVVKPWYDDAAEHLAATSAFLAGGPVAGWEPFEAAVHRFDAGLRQEGGSSRDAIVVTHGTVMTAWLTSTGLVSDPFAFWRGLQLPDAWEVDLATKATWRVAECP